MVNLDGKIFKVRANSANGEVGEKTRFYYRQKDDIVWATYEGGAIKFGTLSGYMEADKLEFTYQHLNAALEFFTGVCKTQVTFENEKHILHEDWQWTCRDHSKGSSVLEECGHHKQAGV